MVVADLGVARGPSALTKVTTAGTAVGTLLYMSPAQIEGGTVDARGDLCSAGLILYRVACGALPFGEQIVDVVARSPYLTARTPAAGRCRALQPCIGDIVKAWRSS